MNRKQGTTFIFSTHDAKVMSHASKVVRLADGRIVETLAGGNGAVATEQAREAH
jgi:putative ABC transport system ATP-binding protein